MVARDLYHSQADLDRLSKRPKQQSVDLYAVPATKRARPILHVDLVPSLELRARHDDSTATAIGHLASGRAVVLVWDDLVLFPGGPASTPIRPRRLRR